jgi:hypothetical protein
VFVAAGVSSLRSSPGFGRRGAHSRCRYMSVHSCLRRTDAAFLSCVCNSAAAAGISSLRWKGFGWRGGFLLCALLLW